MAEQNKVIKGQNLRVFVGGKCVALATSCQLQVSANLEDTSTKDSTGSWDEQEIVSKSWSMSVDALYNAGGTDATGLNAQEMLDLLLAGNRVEVRFCVTGGAQNRESLTATSTMAEYEGSAWINDLSVTAANKSNASYSASLTGDGALTKRAKE
mgnify:CR=1 FL=1